MMNRRHAGWRAGLAAGLLWIPAACAGVVGPGEAAARIGRPVTLEFPVLGVGQSSEGDYLELYSEKTWDEPGCVFVRVPRAFTRRIAELGIVNVENLLKGRTVRAEGVPDWLTFDDAPGRRWVCVTLDDPPALSVLPPRFARKVVHGFTVRIDEVETRYAPREVKAVEAMVEDRLADMARRVPAAVLARLRAIPVTIQRSRQHASAYYDWREKPESLLHLVPWQGVVVANWYEFLRCSREDQPLALLHEFAHAYHHRVLGAGHPGVLDAYRDAMAKGLYDKVERLNDRPQRAYAATNEKEYFCELTEAWFGANDFFPFDRRDLERHDPGGAALMRAVWGEPLAGYGEAPGARGP